MAEVRSFLLQLRSGRANLDFIPQTQKPVNVPAQVSKTPTSNNVSSNRNENVNIASKDVKKPPVPQRRVRPSRPSQLSDEEVLAALKNTVNPGNPLARFQIIKQVGHGCCGKVSTAYDRVTNQVVAIKAMNLFQQQQKMQSILSEIIVMREYRYFGLCWLLLRFFNRALLFVAIQIL